jgi:two-component system response regulator AtoC
MSSHKEPQATVLVIDDDEAVRRQLYWTLSNHYQVLEAAARPEAIEILNRHCVDLVLSDLHLPPHVDDLSEGLAIIEAARCGRSAVPVIVITGSNAKHAALEAVKRGAYGFFEKPVDANEVLHLVRQAVRVRRLEQEIVSLRDALSSARGFNQLIGASTSLENTIKQARAVASTTATVLLFGENGTGKEVLARAIHEESPRARGPFVAVSCAALPEALIESELFWHEKGAFTDAAQARKGRFELADGGTLFLDEISELTPPIQVKLLRVLQERQFERVGGTKTLSVDIRLIAASNRDLEQMIEAGAFRRDLFYRLNVVPLLLPPLRDRRDDIPVLAAHFALKFAAKHARPRSEFDPELLEALQDYDWPGNVRELENLLERIVVLTEGSKLGVEFLPEKMLRLLPEANKDDETTLEGAVMAVRRNLILSALQAEGDNKVAAARRLGISRSYLHRLINEFGI